MTKDQELTTNDYLSRTSIDSACASSPSARASGRIVGARPASPSRLIRCTDMTRTKSAAERPPRHPAPGARRRRRPPPVWGGEKGRARRGDRQAPRRGRGHAGGARRFGRRGPPPWAQPPPPPPRGPRRSEPPG